MSTPALILIVDDDKAIRETLAHSLSNAEYRVLKAASGKEAIDLTLEHNPDLILLDVMMPGLTGFETARIIHDDPHMSMIPILFLTGEAKDISSMEVGFEIGADDYMTKSQSTKEILLRINHALRRHHKPLP
jgi:DNA-binding response OmpR family regulator